MFDEVGDQVKPLNNFPIKATPPFDLDGTLDGLNIIVIDREEDHRELISILLEYSGAKVKSVGFTSEATEILEQWPVDLLVIGIGRDDIDSYALINKIRGGGRKKSRFIPALALTTQTGTEYRIQVLLAGFNLILANLLTHTSWLQWSSLL
jgi:two-component system, OmpR family, response regulator